MSQAELDEVASALVTDVEPGAVWRSNMPTVEAFTLVATQWRVFAQNTDAGSRNVWIGLDYAAVRVSLDAMEIKVGPRLWAGLLVMEQAAMAALNGDGF